MRQTTLFSTDHSLQREYHVLSLRWTGFTPNLLCVEEGGGGGHGSVVEVSFPTELALDVSNEKYCIGRWDGQDHRPCPDNARVTRFNQCDACADDFIPDQQCIFEPKCDGRSCLVEGHFEESIGFCSRPHVVYLAFYGKNPKIGMSSGTRIRRRCIEQGADAFALVTSTEGRREARRIEKQLGKELGIRQSYSSRELLRLARSSINRDEIIGGYHQLSRDIENIIEKSVKDLEFLSEYSAPIPLRSIPRETTTPGPHHGTALGIKGRFLFYDSGGLSALNIGDLPSRRIHIRISG
jgi:hypothetical protein